MTDKLLRIEKGLYRYREHLVWRDPLNRRLWWCNPSKDDWPSCRRTLKEIAKYIDDWETAREDGRIEGNFIKASQETIDRLANLYEGLAINGRYKLLAQISKELLSIKV